MTDKIPTTSQHPAYEKGYEDGYRDGTEEQAAKIKRLERTIARLKRNAE
jgi:hypothetical protein